MQKELVLSAIMLACLDLNAQSIDPSVVVASGEEFTTSVAIANTIGEPLTATLVSGNAALIELNHSWIDKVYSLI